MSPGQENKKPLHIGEVSSNIHDDSIVISGMSGLFPMSDSVLQLSSILYKKVNPVTANNPRAKWNHPEASPYIGEVPDIERFDSQFFMVHNHLGNSMDPMARKALEHAYQAIYDAGLNPRHFNGKKVGVYIAAAYTETEKTGVMELMSVGGFGITGCSKTMFANRISYWLNAKGPSLTLDNDCCGFMVALEEACSAIKEGRCEAAIVGGTYICRLPQVLVHANRCIKISRDDKTKSFDEHASGCTKSEAISILFLQKAKDALRAYAEVVHVKSEFISMLRCETGQEFGFIRNPDVTAEFLKQFYREANIPPQAVEYVEAFGSATPEADKAELQAIEKVFCDGRTDPLQVGSVISNVGLTDAASGATAITKVLLGYHNSLIAGNLNCTKPRQDISAIRKGHMSILTDHQTFRGTYAAVNCLSVTGVNSHVLLRRASKSKDSTKYKSPIPYLVTLSARQEQHLKSIFSSLKSHPIDPEELALLHNIHSTNIPAHLGRGYIILDTNDDTKDTVSVIESALHYDEVHRPLWFVYSGMGSQWAGMGAQLMRIPIFAAAIRRCQKILEPKGVNLVDIITSPDKTMFDNVQNSFVGIAAIQIGLTDILTTLGLKPDKIIGHSVGELGCAYADGCLTSEEMILSAYSRGKASNDTILIRGAMAAIGLGYQQLSKMCPPSIDIACHNSPTSCTISGPEENVCRFVKTLKNNGVFVKEVESANIAYHSRYIADAAPILLDSLNELLTSPRARSERWLSTSVQQERWNEPVAKYCSAEYLTNNLLSPVYFEETSKLIPSNAVLVEIAPHGLLQAILKRSLPDSCRNIPLTQRSHNDNALFLLDAIGKLYVEGFTPLVQALYPKIEFPVSTGTPHLGQYVKWNHSESWVIPRISDCNIKIASSCKFLISTHDDEHKYLRGNIVEGKILYPFTGALVAVWDTLAMTLGAIKKGISVKFQDVHLFSQPILHDQKILKLNVSIQRASGLFEVLSDNSKIATGRITILSNSEKSETKISGMTRNENVNINTEELYEHLSSRGFFYKDAFQSIHSVEETSLSEAQLVWTDNWVTMIDGLLQLNTLRQVHDGVSHPTQIRELTIDVEEHQKSVQKHKLVEETLLRADVDDIFDRTRCGGVTIKNIKFRNLPSANSGAQKLLSSSVIENSSKNILCNPVLENVAPRKKTILQIDSVGDLETLHWEEETVIYEEGVKIVVEYAGINTLDLKRATGTIPFEGEEKCYGMDFSGTTESGERVMGLVRNGAASNIISALPELLWPVPAHWSLEEAATVPLAYIQAYYCLFVKSDLQPGSRILIHGASGALGQAAVSLALAHGCQIFATVANSAKKRFLLRLFPLLNEEHIGCSRDASFGDMVLNATNGEGCSIILSCIREDLKNISLKCTAFAGVTIDTVQIHNRDIFEYGMSNMTKSRSYIAVDFYSIFDSGNRAELAKLRTLLSDGIARGVVRPLSRVVFDACKVARAFRLLSASRHRGRVLLHMRNHSSQPRITCSPYNTYLVVWDGSQYGLQLVHRLISRGARKIRIYYDNTIKQLHIKLRLWHKLGVDVEVVQISLNDCNTVDQILDEVSRLGPVEGIFVTATVGLDATLDKQLVNVIDHLDNSSRKLCPLLQYFAVISNNNVIGQKTCRSRNKKGFCATSLNILGYKSARTLQNESTDSSWRRCAVDITEQALVCEIPVISAQLQYSENSPMLKFLATIPDKIDDNLTLHDMDIDELLPRIKTLLRDVYQVYLDDEQISLLTKRKLLEIEINASEHEHEDLLGLNKFFSVVDDNELQANLTLIPLNTLVYDVKMMNDYIDASRTTLFIIPGVEGHHARFRTLCERLKVPAFVLQPGLEHPNETPRDTATRYSKILLQSFKFEGAFYLLGYECGITTTLELASILEDLGLTGTVYCLGAGPEETKSLLEAELSTFRDSDALQAGVARHMCALMAGDAAHAPDERALLGCGSWRSRVDACVRALLGRVSHSAQYARALLEAAYARIHAQRRYKAERYSALRSQLVLMRPRDVPRATRPTELQRYSQRPLIEHDIDAPMALAAADLQVPAIVNRYLDDDVQAAYNSYNYCNTYLSA